MKKETDKNYSFDIDRMINEGMSGGQIIQQNNTTNIEEARKLEEEDPPHSNE